MLQVADGTLHISPLHAIHPLREFFQQKTTPGWQMVQALTLLSALWLESHSINIPANHWGSTSNFETVHYAYN